MNSKRTFILLTVALLWIGSGSAMALGYKPGDQPGSRTQVRLTRKDRHAYQNRMMQGKRSVTWSAWLTKTAQNLSRQENGDTKNVSNDPVGQATAVSAAVNAHINGLYAKDASQQIGVEFFDEIQWLQLADESSDDDTPETTVSSRDGAYIAFKHVDFGSNAVSKLLLRAKATAPDAKIQVYVDDISSETLVAVSKGPLPTSWDNLVLDASKSLSGVHTSGSCIL